MNLDQMFPSNYLKASDVEHSPVVTIKSLEFETLKGENGDEEKPIVYFNEFDKGMVLNKTNGNTIGGLYGRETDAWIGQRIMLFAADVDAYGKTTRAIRVSAKKPPVDKAVLLKHYSALWEKAKALKVEDVDNYVVSPDMSEQEITTLGKELKAKVDAAQAFA